MSENQEKSNGTPDSFNNGNKAKKPKFNVYWVYAFIAVAFVAIQFVSFSPGPQSISMSSFLNEMLKSGEVEKVTIINKDKAEVTIKKSIIGSQNYKKYYPQGKIPPDGPHFYFNIGSMDQFEKRMEAIQANLPEDQRITASYETHKDVWADVLGWLLPIILIVAVWIFIFRKMGGSGGGGGGNIFNIGKSRAKVFDKEENNIKINFGDVAGLQEAKLEVTEIVDFLKNPQKYTLLGGKIPKGALLVGPPGTGKTLLAKAVAGEANVPFFSMSGSDFVEMFVGVGASRVRDLFYQAKAKAPCIIFIDEIDAIGRARGRNPNFNSNDERENTLNQLLTEMDGFDTNTGVIILAATNRQDMLDSALLRAGRFDRLIHVELPDLNERREIFKVHMKNLKVDENLDMEFLAKQTPGFSGADIANVCNEAALFGARKEKTAIEKQDFLDAIDRIVGGL